MLLSAPGSCHPFPKRNPTALLCCLPRLGLSRLAIQLQNESWSCGSNRGRDKGRLAGGESTGKMLSKVRVREPALPVA